MPSTEKTYSLLLIDSDEIVRRAVVRVLASLPIDVAVASSIEEARRKIDERRFDVICWPSRTTADPSSAVLAALKECLGLATWHIAYTTHPDFANALIEAGCTPEVRLSMKQYMPRAVAVLLKLDHLLPQLPADDTDPTP